MIKVKVRSKIETGIRKMVKIKIRIRINIEVKIMIAVTCSSTLIITRNGQQDIEELNMRSV